MSDFTNFRAIYDELTDAVARSRHKFFVDALTAWFDHLDETPAVAEEIKQLESGQDAAAFLAQAQSTKGSFIGSGRLDWPKPKDDKLGMKLAVFRRMARGEEDVTNFTYNYAYVTNNFDANLSAMIEQIFSPMARELRRYLESRDAAGTVPAADRFVRRDDNTKALFEEAIEALKKLEEALHGQNDFESVEVKDQVVAELSAAQRLLSAARVRVDALVAVVKKPLAYIGKKFVDTGLSKLAGVAIERITHLIGTFF